MEASRQNPRQLQELTTSPTTQGSGSLGPQLTLSGATADTAVIARRQPVEPQVNTFSSVAAALSAASTSTASTAVVGDGPKPLLSTTSIRDGEMHRKEARNAEVAAVGKSDIPPPIHYDAVIFHDVRDLERAELFRMRLLSVLGTDGEGVRVSVFGCEADPGKLYHEQLSDAVQRSTYLILFVTRNLCDGGVMGLLLRDQLLVEMLENPEKRWCLIPVWTEPEAEYIKPLPLKPLVGISEKTMSDKFRRESIIKMFTGKRTARVLREQEEQKRLAEEYDRRQRKLKDDEEERQHRERLHLLKEVHERELRDAQRKAELDRQIQMNDLKRREELNSAVLGDQLMQMQYIHQNARHTRDQLMIEEWQKDAVKQAYAIGGYIGSMPTPAADAPSVLRPRGGEGPAISAGVGGLWMSSNPEVVSQAAATSARRYQVNFPPVPGLHSYMELPASFSPLTNSPLRHAFGDRYDCAYQHPLPIPLPQRPCTAEETLLQANDLLQQLCVSQPRFTQTPSSADQQPPAYSNLFTPRPANVPSPQFPASTVGLASSPACSVSSKCEQENAPTLPYGETVKSTPVAVAQATNEKSLVDAAKCSSYVTDSAYTKVDDIRKNQQALLLDCAEQRRSAPLPPEQARTNSDAMQPLSSYDRTEWHDCSRAVQPRDLTLSTVYSDAGTSDRRSSSMEQQQPTQLQDTAASADFLILDRQLQQLPQGYVAVSYEHLAALNATLLQALSQQGNAFWPSPMLQPMALLPLDPRTPQGATGRLPHSQSVPAYSGEVVNAGAVDPRFHHGRWPPASGSSQSLTRGSGYDHHSTSRSSSSHVGSAAAAAPVRAVSHQDSSSRSSGHAHTHRRSSGKGTPISTQCTDVDYQHPVWTNAGLSARATSDRGSASLGGNDYRAGHSCDDASLGTGSSSASEGTGSLSSGLSSYGTGSSSGNASSLDSGHGPIVDYRASPLPSISSGSGRPGNIPLTVFDSYNGEPQPLTIHPPAPGGDVR